MKTTKILLLCMVAVMTLSVGCRKDTTKLQTTHPNRQFGIFSVLTDDTTIELNGEISSRALSDFNRLLAAYPKVAKIQIKNCGGSSDDTVNLQLSAKVHQKGMNIHLLDNGEIASGGVDFFVAGIKRTQGSNTKIGVHSWSDGTNQATDFPVGHANHLPYIRYYVSVGFTQQQAERFYYFTINAAPASAIHWMTAAEIKQYGLIKK